MRRMKMRITVLEQKLPFDRIEEQWFQSLLRTLT
jgi:hypothetical protein